MASERRRPLLNVVALVAISVLSRGTAWAADGSEAASHVNSFYGAFGTEVPIAMPAFRGLEPGLKLVYSSSGGNGWIGVGWSLAGESYIERASPGRGAPRYDATDIFVMDGDELVADTSLGGTHSTRIQSYLRVVRDAPNDRWYVYRKDGTKATYTSLYTTASGTFRWGLKTVEDTRGNAVTYDYWCDPGADCYLDTITYNGTTVKLYREARPDPISVATGLSLGRTSYRLRTIDVKVSGSRARAYKLAYTTSTSTSRSLLASVQQYGRDATLDASGTVTGGSALPALAVSYGDEANQLQQETWETTASDWGSGLYTKVGDFNGDGKTDIATANGANIYVHVSTGASYVQHTWSTTASGWGAGEYTWAADANGDGRSDIVTANGAYIYVFRSTGTSFVRETWESTANSWGPAAFTNTGDFNGDGKSDIVTVSGTTMYVHVSSGSAYTQQVWSMNASDFQTYCPVFAFDANGDGKTDVVKVRHVATAEGDFHNVDVYRSAGDHFAGQETWISFRYYESHPWWIGDFNGDGMGDLSRLYPSIDYELGYMFSTGQSYVPLDIGSYDFGYGYVLPADVNGDGAIDVVMPSWDDRIVVHRFAGLNFKSEQWAALASDWGSLDFTWPADVDGDGDADIVTANGANIYVYKSSSSIARDLVVGVTNGVGGTTAVTYTPSSAWSNTYLPTGMVIPTVSPATSNTYLPTGMVIPTVSSVTTTDGRGHSSTTSYSYEGGLWSDSERRFLGFRKATAVIDAAGNYTETYYHQHVGCISKPETTYFRDATGNIYSYSQMYYQENAAPPYKSLMTERWDYTCNRDASCRRVVSQLAYDTYGNAIETKEYGDYDVAGDERTHVMGYVPNTAAYIVGLPAYENRYVGLGTGGQLVSHMLYVYDGNASYDQPPTVGNQVKKRQWNSATGLYHEVSFAYDGYGNLVRETNAKGNATTLTYDATYHLFQTGQCNAVGHCVSFAYDGVLGQMTSKTAAGGLVTTFAYDALGRATGRGQTGGATVSYSYPDLGNPNAQRMCKTVADGSPGGLVECAYLDGLGRTYKTVVEDSITTETVYSEISNRVWKKSLPYAVGETPVYQVFTYDGAGRQVRTTNPDGTYAERIHGDDHAIDRDELGHEKTTWTDGLGRTVRIDEKNGAETYTTRYEHDAMGNVMRSVDALGNQTTATYNSLGHKLSMCDPDRGCSSFTYDAAGNVLSRTDAKGQTTTFAYDATGRLLTQTSQDGAQSSWSYDEGGEGAIGMATNVSYPNGSESMSYDGRGRLVQKTRCVGSVCYTVASTYDVTDRVATVSYPDGEVVTYAYDTLGRLASVSGYVGGISYNASGQVTGMTYANGTTQSYSYDGSRAWLTASQVTGPGGTLYQASYAYDAGARVTSTSSTTDSLLNVSYSYDDLSRLTGVSGAQSQTFAYDALGRMTYNSEVGSYTYGNASHAHAVTAAGASSYAYDASGNMISGAGRTFAWDAENRLVSVSVDGETCNTCEVTDCGACGAACNTCQVTDCALCGKVRGKCQTCQVTDCGLCGGPCNTCPVTDCDLCGAASPTTFAYDASGQRVAKTTGSGTTRYFGGLLEQRPDGTLVKYVYAGPMLVARKTASGAAFYHADRLGSVQLMTDAGGSVVRAADFAAYGAMLADSGTLADDHGFTGHRTDAESGLIYMNARYYDAALGRFISADSVVPDPGNPQAFDRYAYAYNNPVNNADPTGHAPVAAAVIGAAVGVAAGVITVTTAIIAVACVTIGYLTENPLLMSIGQVILGYAGGAMYGMGGLGAAVAALTSPISPLDPGLKQAIGWAFMAYGLIKAATAPDYEYLGMNCDYERAASGMDILDLPGDPQALESAFWDFHATFQESGRIIEGIARSGLSAEQMLQLPWGEWDLTAYFRNTSNGEVIQRTIWPGHTEGMSHALAAADARDFGIFDPFRRYTGATSKYVGELYGSVEYGYAGYAGRGWDAAKFNGNLYGCSHDAAVAAGQDWNDWRLAGDGAGGISPYPAGGGFHLPPRGSNWWTSLGNVFGKW